MLSNTFKVLALLSATAIGLLFYQGAFVHVEVEKTQLNLKNFVYFNRIGRYETVYDDYLKVVEAMTSSFEKSVTMGIYYDNPHTIDNVDNSRLSMGFLVDDSEVSKINSFLKINPKYSHAKLPGVESLKTSFPYRNYLSFAVSGFKVYPVLNNYFQTHGISPIGVIEVYKFGGEKQAIEFYAPYGKGSEKYILV